MRRRFSPPNDAQDEPGGSGTAEAVAGWLNVSCPYIPQ
jgi:hypothetical protein